MKVRRTVTLTVTAEMDEGDTMIPVVIEALGSHAAYLGKCEQFGPGGGPDAEGRQEVSGGVVEWRHTLEPLG